MNAPKGTLMLCRLQSYMIVFNIYAINNKLISLFLLLVITTNYYTIHAACAAHNITLNTHCMETSAADYRRRVMGEVSPMTHDVIINIIKINQ